jgi:predicted RNA-binding Zn-ribbon protein involved in translation (DUF1610 family)
MSQQSPISLAQEQPNQARSTAERAKTPATSCATRPAEQAAICPACGEAMRLWANYHRCRNCGFKESCCF